ncbi:hypothetical protein TPHA_0F01070 [Tetrapisispora phaffii CBS 4417]|uniref:5'-3' DNA helicase ZGRF1-like N-terminal domain-containing protein n=1 Tax=Tetrapisispora phaffii (strain ATCC 24235 / CBS 4417 / NBRC 1672 / NRRL Y-8282 / UCD 70-5) TaxID=1071381 RepID=G8BV10_TETPH|nr:hypothetical protein TPHA_0F01070 [Tetrapisispora phaffii CBS 4417]CCE63592.1 hypothetical protein TPHA_0F01070 [Tetrapisispora phaffii CBS 4417]
MNSHITEYQCQYTDQIRKKNKVWHDGKLKYFQINDKFQLFREEDNIQISSQFITNKKEVEYILDPENFDNIEHKIFGKYIVIILEKINEYDKEVKITLKHNNIPPSQANTIHFNNNTLHLNGQSVTNTKSNSLQGKVIVKKPLSRIITSKVIADTSSISGTSLALKMNKPFKRPRMANHPDSNLSRKIVKNRPSVRTDNVRLKEEDTSNNDTNIKSNELHNNDANTNLNKPKPPLIPSENEKLQANVEETLVEKQSTSPITNNIIIDKHYAQDKPPLEKQINTDNILPEEKKISKSIIQKLPNKQSSSRIISGRTKIRSISHKPISL